MGFAPNGTLFQPVRTEPCDCGPLSIRLQQQQPEGLRHRTKPYRGGLRSSATVEVKRWALSWGADCDVLGPEELREEIKAELQAMMEILNDRSRD